MTKNELFRYWINHGMTPERLLENYAARHNLTKEDVEQVKQIIAFAVHLECARRLEAQKKCTASP